MTVSKTDYLERFLDAMDRVAAGRPGGITEDRWLVNNYSAGFLPLVDKYLDYSDDRVVAETVTLLTDVRERAVHGRVRELSRSSGERVRMACLGYLTTMSDDDDAIPVLFDTVEHCTGAEFHRAAVRLAAIAREEDLPRVRRVYGQVSGEMRTDMRVVMDRIIARNPSQEPKRELIMSLPVYPDEGAFDRFLDSVTEYIDGRYRSNVHPAERVSVGTHNNVVRALGKMRTRLYNESDNLQYYGPDKTDRFHEALDLVSWANRDLAGKEVVGRQASSSRACPRCGGLMSLYKGSWSCPDCGGA